MAHVPVPTIANPHMDPRLVAQLICAQGMPTSFRAGMQLQGQDMNNWFTMADIILRKVLGALHLICSVR